MNFFLQVGFNGLAAGALYGLIAVGYSLTYTTTRTLNFALGMWVMFGGMLTYSLNVVHGLAPMLVLPLVMGMLFGMGILAERFSVFPFLRAQSELWVMSTLAVGLLLIDVTEIVWGRTQQGVPAYLGSDSLRVGTVFVQPHQLLMIAAAAATFLALDFFYRGTLLGKAFRAVAFSADVSSLMGIPARRVQMLSYALSAALAGMAGFLIVPVTGAHAHLGTGLGFKAFAVAIIGGLTAPRGILVTGLLYGAAEGLISGYLHSGLRDIVVFSLMILALYLLPEGIFGSRTKERP